MSFCFHKSGIWERYTSTSYIYLHGEGTRASRLSWRKLSNKRISMMKC